MSANGSRSPDVHRSQGRTTAESAARVWRSRVSVVLCPYSRASNADEEHFS